MIGEPLLRIDGCKVAPMIFKIGRDNTLSRQTETTAVGLARDKQGTDACSDFRVYFAKYLIIFSVPNLAS